MASMDLVTVGTSGREDGQRIRAKRTTSAVQQPMDHQCQLGPAHVFMLPNLVRDVQRKPPPRNPHESWGSCEWRPPHKQRLETGRADFEAKSRSELRVPAFAFPPKPRQHWASRAQEKGQSKSGLVSSGGEDEDRTHDLCIANAALSHLSYPPTVAHSSYGGADLHYAGTVPAARHVAACRGFGREVGWRRADIRIFTLLEADR